MWYQEVDAPRKQVVDNIVIENCRFFGLNSNKSGMFGLSTKQDAPVHNFVFRNSTFHANDLSRALITGLGSMTGELNVTIENLYICEYGSCCNDLLRLKSEEYLFIPLGCP